MARKRRYQWDAAAADAQPPRKSRSQAKRESAALQDMGRELSRLPLNALDTLPLTADLRDALRLMARLTDHEGRRRQLQYIGRLMREADGEAIAAALERLRQGPHEATALLHHAERLRHALLHGDAAAQERVLAPFPPEEQHHLRQLAAQAAADTPAAKGAARALFRRLRALLAPDASQPPGN